MNLQWNEKFTTGYETMDRQHKELFEMITTLYGAMSANRGRDKIIEMTNFLHKHLEEHLDTEAELMVRFNYPDYETHDKLHFELRDTFAQIKEHIESVGVTTMSGIRIQQLVSHLIKHFAIADLKLATFLKSQTVEA